MIHGSGTGPPVRLYRREPAAPAVQLQHLIDMGEALSAACAELVRNPCSEQADALPRTDLLI
mgnify:CR=1 FL=1